MCRNVLFEIHTIREKHVVVNMTLCYDKYCDFSYLVRICFCCYDGVRLFVCGTTATKGPIFYPPDDT
jgi:hypothetical protein